MNIKADHLFVNGEDFGIYVGSSSIDKTFLKKQFGTKKGILFKCDPDYDKADDWLKILLGPLIAPTSGT